MCDLGSKEMKLLVCHRLPGLATRISKFDADSHVDTDETEFDRLFPLETTDINAVPPLRDLSEFEIETRNQRVREAMFKVDPVPDVEDAKPLARMGDQYQLYGRVECLPDTVRAFYEEVADVVGLSLRDLSRAVYGLELLIVSHQK